MKRLASWETAALAAILLFAALLRMSRPGLVEFKRDEALLMHLALDAARLDVPLQGISSSVGIPNAPLSAWLYALPLAVWPHVYAATLFTGLANVAAVAGSWWLARRYWGVAAGVAAALLYAASPWAIFHSQKIWAQNLLAPFVVAYGVSACLAFVEGRRVWLVAHILLLALVAQIHFAALALAPATMVLLVLFRRRVAWRLLALAALLALLTAAPYLLQLARGSSLDLSAAAGAIRAESGRGDGAWRFAWLLVSGREIHALAGPEAFRAFLATVPDLTAVHLLWTGLVVAGLSLLAWQAWKRLPGADPAAEAGLVVALWFLSPLLVLSLPGLPAAIHYLLPALPAAYVAGGVAFSALLARAARWRWAAWAVLGGSAAAQAAVWLALIAFVGGRATPGGYGTPVHFHLQAASGARQIVEGDGAAEVLVAGLSEDATTDEFAAVYDVLLDGVPHRFVNVGRSAVFPDAGAAVILGPQAAGGGSEAYRRTADRERVIPLRTGDGALGLLWLPAAAAPPPAIALPAPISFANRVSLMGYDALIQSEAAAAGWQIYWRPAGGPAAADYHFFNHLIDGRGERVGQEDAAAFSAPQWRAGDTVISFFRLPWTGVLRPPLTMRTGMYSYPDLVPVPVLDAAGNPAADAAELPLPAP